MWPAAPPSPRKGPRADARSDSDVAGAGRTPWSVPAAAVVAALGSDASSGLAAAEAARRLEAWGPNALQRHARRSLWSLLTAQLRSLIIGLLALAMVAALAFGETLEAYAIGAVIVLTVGIGFGTELRAVRSMEALFALGVVACRVRRGGQVLTLPAEAVVPGDLVLLEGGDVVTADVRLLHASRLQADESALTGESLPVNKAAAPAPAEAPLAERTSMLYKGTAVVRGAAVGVVVHTGMATELGAISALVEQADPTATPLEARLARLGRTLIGATVVVAAAVSATGVMAGKDVFLMIETGIALAVAAVPEGLPVVATIALARGVRRMARRHALLNRLAAVETLGSTRVIMTDKTGTLTENRMTVTRFVAPGRAAAEPAADLPPDTMAEVAVLCNDASLPSAPGDRGSGDPMEVALLVFAREAGVEAEPLAARFPRVGHEAFDSDVKMMATVHQSASAFRFAVKGAPEAVLQACTHEAAGPSGRVPLEPTARARWQAQNEHIAREGLRVLMLAEKTEDRPDAPPYEGLSVLGLVAFEDPPREDVAPALAACRSAGIEVVMVTGDQAPTALGIGRAIGLLPDGEPRVVTGAALAALDVEAHRDELLDVHVFARMSPRQKLDLVRLHQSAGHVVAMTGDGVNDAPALKQADIGVAMGQRGTQVAREAADMVLQDDAFASIVAAVRQGRIIFDNIRRFVVYLLSCNVSEVMVVGLAAAAGLTLPLLPLQILFLNLVTDVLPALALGMSDGDANVMTQPPREASDPIMTRRHWAAVGAYGATITAAVLGALIVAQRMLAMPAAEAVTISFLTLALAQLWHVFNMRARGSRTFANEVTRNRWVWAALGACLLLVAAAVTIPLLRTVLHIVPPDATGWALIVGASLVPLAVGTAYHALMRALRRTAPEQAAAF